WDSDVSTSARPPKRRPTRPSGWNKSRPAPHLVGSPGIHRAQFWGFPGGDGIDFWITRGVERYDMKRKVLRLDCICTGLHRPRISERRGGHGILGDGADAELRGARLVICIAETAAHAEAVDDMRESVSPQRRSVDHADDALPGSQRRYQWLH